MKHITIQKITPQYWCVTFDNPPLNLVNVDTYTDLLNLLDEVENDSEVKVLVFDSANPDFFLAHFDVARAAEKVDKTIPSELPAFIDIATRLERSPVVSIAKIRGRARGVGSEFALVCDMRFASLEKTILGQPEVGTGVIPGGGGIERLSLLVGRARALEIVLGGEDFHAPIAERYGWINRAIPDDELDSFVDRFAHRLSTFDQQALKEAKRLINRSGLPDVGHLLETLQIFRSASTWQGAQERIPRALKKGLGQPGDFELRFGDYLNEL
ncbi:enoyl-CoA hydratase/isomerase family protein [Marininema halotolerans]|uniref:Enoyl-CoA hydratase/carnithine racemase n=1 Tax=Marininema halotolerans TaxID=1155944 RepID=A0A1I6SF35_9BACL|nr:enoyl-CoA hydratase/isomerase family protein [Marininema halotolerans]SFS75430.1 Enoyl-CoA hydratase/carnithine racemase [Marininema halotolerans]